MRSNKRRIDARIPVWLYDALIKMAWNRGYNFTEMLQAAAEKGLTWYIKQWEKMHPNKKDGAEPSESCPNSYENDTKETREVSNEEVDEVLKGLYEDDIQKNN